MRHEITRDTVVGVVQQDFHKILTVLAKGYFAVWSTGNWEKNPPSQFGRTPWRCVGKMDSFECTLAYSVHQGS